MPDLVCPPGFSDRLDRALARLVDGLSRTAARRLIAAGNVFVGGRRCRVASRTVREGNRLRLEVEARASSPPVPPILHEDSACIAIDKPEGMPAAPTRQGSSGTAIEDLKEYLRRRDGRATRLWLVHRLDSGTSGVLLFARTRAAAARLDAAFRERLAQKEYVAWVAGDMATEGGTIDTPLRTRGSRSEPDPRGQAAETTWEVSERREGRTRLVLHPSTGRMHQLRVHLASIGHPVLGDRLYGGPHAPRLMLHASRLRLPHPSAGMVLDIQAPPPF